MRKELLEDIDRIIKQAALDGALTEDAIGYYNGLIKVAEEKKAENERLTQQVADLDKKRSKLEGDKAELLTQLNAFVERERELKTREDNCMRMEVEKACADSRVKDHQEMFRLVFRNTVVRRGIPTPGFPSYVDSYGTEKHGEYSTVHQTEEEET